MAPLGMESKHITHDFEIERIEWSGNRSGSIEVDAPFIIHCAGRREQSFNCFSILFCDSNFFSVNWFMYVQ